MSLGYFRIISKKLFQVDDQKVEAVQHSVGVIVPVATDNLLFVVAFMYVSSCQDTFHNSSIIHRLEPQITYVYSLYN